MALQEDDPFEASIFVQMELIDLIRKLQINYRKQFQQR